MASADFKSVRVAAQPGLVGSIPMRFRHPPSYFEACNEGLATAGESANMGIESTEEREGGGAPSRSSAAGHSSHLAAQRVAGTIPMRFRQISLHCVPLALRASPLRSDKFGRLTWGKDFPKPLSRLLPGNFVRGEGVELPAGTREVQHERVPLVRFGQDAGA